MLSAETTVGRYPVEAVEAMAEIAVEAERGALLSLDPELDDLGTRPRR